MRLTFVFGLALTMTAPALAQESQAPATCPGMDATLPAGLEDWNGDGAVDTATSLADRSAPPLALGKGYTASLLNTPKAAFAVQPEKPGGSVSYSGLFRFTTGTSGTYTVALSSGAWIDVIEGGKALEPVSFGHGPECSTIRKTVVYVLAPGEHLLQVAGVGGDKVKLLVARRP